MATVLERVGSEFEDSSGHTPRVISDYSPES